MNYKTLLFSFSMVVFFFSCKNDKPSTAQVSNENTEQLNYGKMRELVFSHSDGERVEWHGEALDESAKGDLEFVEGQPCGESDCGKLIVLKNNSDKAIESVVQSAFSVPDLPTHTATKLTVPANGTATVGCSHLCFGGESFVFSPKVVGAIHLE